MAIKILILGHKGMLGNAVHSYFSHISIYKVYTIATRFGEAMFIEDIQAISPNYIINCIGAIPQKNKDPSVYEQINIELPTLLETLEIPIIHPSTDCEFSGILVPTSMYTKQDIRDAEDVYGKSKALISQKIEKEFTHTKIIRTSIIGHELDSHVSLLDWFLHSSQEVNGYNNHYWNGITTLEWSKLCESIISEWDAHPLLNQYGTPVMRSKYDLLRDIKRIYNKDIEIKDFEAPTTINKCLASDKELKPISEQLQELKEFYKNNTNKPC